MNKRLGGVVFAVVFSSVVFAQKTRTKELLVTGQFQSPHVESVFLSNIEELKILKKKVTEAQKKLSSDLLPLVNPEFLLKTVSVDEYMEQMAQNGLFQQAGVEEKKAAEVAESTEGMVYVYIYLEPNTSADILKPYASLVNEDERFHMAVAWVEVEKLEALASLDAVLNIRTVVPPVINTGSVETEGDEIHRTSDVREQYSYSGKGIKVGIISNGVNHLSDAGDDLPAVGSGLTVLSNLYAGDEGTAMLEIVYDMVPDAELYFHDCGSNVLAFNNAISSLVAAGCNVICDDIGWITQPFYEDGQVATHVASVLSENDIVYVSSAGNSGQRHYQGDFCSLSNTSEHDFSGSGSKSPFLYVSITSGGYVRIVLQWNDEWGASGNDYDLYLYNRESNEIVGQSNGIQDGNDSPLEYISYTNNTGAYATYSIRVVKNGGENKNLEVFIYSSGAFVYSNNISARDAIFGHAAVPGAVAVGAISASDPGNVNIENFSSQGPVTISYPAGETRNKPDVCGIDCVSVTGVGGFGSPFSGTSASAPHIAAIAAQLWSALPGKSGNTIRDLILQSSVDLGTNGFDYIFGNGRADAMNAYNSVGFPVISVFSVPDNIQPATVKVSITATDNIAVTGYYLVADDATTPQAGAAGWVSEKPTEITLTEGDHTLYLWAKDTGDNISTVKTASVTVDATAPVISVFTCPTSTTAATIGLTITAGDNKGVTGYLVKTEGSTPDAEDVNWTADKPAGYSFPEQGDYTLYLWAKDAAGNISTAASASVTYTQEEESGHFVPVWTGSGYNHMNISAVQVQLNGADLESGDEVGIFDGDLCVGAAVLTGTVSGSNMLDLVVSCDDGTGNGYTAGNTVSYRVYLKSYDEEVEICSATYEENSNFGWITNGTFVIGGTAIVTLSCDNTTEQEVAMIKNWNIVSTNVVTSSPSMDVIFGTAVSNGTLIKVIDQKGHTYEDWGFFGGWKNNIGNMIVAQGYHVKASSDFSIQVSGTPIRLPVDIALSAGWNIISWPAAEDRDAEDVFSSIISLNLLRKVMDESGHTMVDWGTDYGGWKNNIGNLTPGKGYLVYVYSDCTLTIGKYGEKSARIVPFIVKGSHFVPEYEGNGYYHMDVKVPNLTATGLKAGDEIAFFDGDICVGSARLSNTDIDFDRLSVACSCDDGYSAGTNGFTPGNAICVKIYHNGEEKSPDVEYLKGAPVYERGGDAIISFNADQLADTEDVVIPKFEACAYPNPFSVESVIEVTMGSSGNLMVEITDMTGSKVRKIYNGKPGHDHVVLTWDGKNESGQTVSPGVYFCRVNEKVIRLVRK